MKATKSSGASLVMRVYFTLWLLVLSVFAMGCSDDGSTGPGLGAALDGGSTGTDSGTTGTDTGATGTDTGRADVDVAVLGEVHSGVYHLGPVEWTGSFTNACEPYPVAIQELTGQLLAGLSNEVARLGDYCDACIEVETAQGQTVVAQVVTYGVTQEAGNIDLSQAAYDAIHQGEFPRTMTWRLVECPTTAPIYIQFQTGAHQWWTSFWVRNPRAAVSSVEIRSVNHTDFFALRRETDGTFNDDGGFGEGAFTLRITAVDGRTVEVGFEGFEGGDLLDTQMNF